MLKRIKPPTVKRILYARIENAFAHRLDNIYTERLLTTDPLPEDRQKVYLDWCLDLARRRINEIVSGKHRHSYNKAAELTTACAEVLRLRGNKQQARGLLEEIRSRYPRHSAFQRKMQAATSRMRT